MAGKWQLPLHPLQVVGMFIYGFLVASFYTFLGLFLGGRTTVIVVTSIFSFTALAVMFLFVRCTAIDPSDRTNFKRKKNKKGVPNSNSQLNYGFILGHIVMRLFTRVEQKILRRLELKSISKHFILCDYVCIVIPRLKSIASTAGPIIVALKGLITTAGLKSIASTAGPVIVALKGLMLMIEGGTAIAIFVRCFADAQGIDRELVRKLHFHFPRGVLSAICVLLVLLTAYGSAALGQLFFFHVVLIRKMLPMVTDGYYYLVLLVSPTTSYITCLNIRTVHDSLKNKLIKSVIKRGFLMENAIDAMIQRGNI